MKTETKTNIGEVNMARRSFLRYAGAGVAGVGLLAAASCHKDHNVIPSTTAGVDIGSGDTGILNFAYALEQLEAAFYIQVIKTPYSGISASELAGLTAIRDHEVLHRNFFKAAIGAAAIPALTVNFSAIDFTSRSSVLAAAVAFEDTGVTAYDGAGYLIKDADYLTLAGKIVSVEARHAAYIHNLISPGTFVAGQIDANSVNVSQTIPQVLAIANAYLVTKVSAKSYNYTA
jgi:hypothetical protein